MLITSIFSFSHNVFYSIKDRNYHLYYIYFVVCKCFQFGQGQIFVVWEWVEHFYEHCQSYSRNFLNSESFHRKTTSDWLNHTFQPIRICVTFQFTKFCRKRKLMFMRIVHKHGLLFSQQKKKSCYTHLYWKV